MEARLMRTATKAPSRGRARADITKKRDDEAFERELVALMPHLQNFSHMLCRRGSIAEDIAQEALAKAWRGRDRFEPGTNLKGWLFTILRNEIYSYKRREWRHAPWDEVAGERIPAPADEQDWAMDLSDCVRALGQLPAHQRDAVLLVGAAGFSYENASNLLDTPVGTLKSRLTRGRENLAKLLTNEKPLKPRTATPARNGMDDVLAQMAAVEAVGASRALHM
jgi:RNA polymerase sigma-70 factor (ECF subfamily)